MRAMRPKIQFTRVGVCLAEFDNDRVNVSSAPPVGYPAGLINQSINP